MRDLKLAPGAYRMCMDDAFRDTFAAEVSQGFNELSVLKQHQALDRRAIAKALHSDGVCIWAACWRVSDGHKECMHQD